MTANHIHVLHTARVRNFAQSTIPMPAPSYHLETAVRLGDRGKQFVVETWDSKHYVYPVTLPRRRPMRQCGLRDRILAAVDRALPGTAPCTEDPT